MDTENQKVFQKNSINQKSFSFLSENANIFLKLKKNRLNKNYLEKKNLIFDPMQNSEVYSNFRLWVFLSIKPYKKYFKKFLIPLAFCFLLDLLEKGHFIEAKVFLTRFNSDFKKCFLDLNIHSIKNKFFLKNEIKKIIKFVKRIIFKIEIEVNAFSIFIEYFEKKKFFKFFKFLNEKFQIILIKKNVMMKKNNNKNLPKKIEHNESFKKDKNDKFKKKIEKEQPYFDDLNLNTPNISKVCKLFKFITQKCFRLNSLEISKNENSILTGWQDSSVCCFEKLDKNVKKKSVILKAHSSSVYLTKYSACDNFFLTGSINGELKFWSAKTKRLLINYENLYDPIWDAAFSEKNSFFVTGGSNKSPLLWNPSQIFPLRIFKGHSSDINVVRWHPCGSVFASGSSDSLSFLWDIRSAKAIGRIESYESSIYSLEFSPNGLELMMAGLSNKMDFWDIRMNKLRKRIFDKLDRNTFTNGAYGQKDELFAYTSEKRNIKMLGNFLFPNFESKTKQKISNPILISTKFDKIFQIRFNDVNRLMVLGTESDRYK
ncbi:taf90 (nucleomorph) [Hemiselmis andersenii]|uniref:Taf90 n=1 Tax=Hemiselmis andersenii TaxID=464988 RepID=A9BL64_HEMAN|nr:taf90 [Hemiselmis andersenii]ABW98247.1 taf90 [Hemiselmis andersenii]